MQQFRVSKPKPGKSSKPRKSWNDRRVELADSLSIPSNAVMVACSECVSRDVVCYFDRERSVKCAECLRRQCDCDGSFSLEEFRKVAEQKKQIQSKSRDKRREIARLRAVLAAAEAEDVELQDSVAKLDDVSDRMLRREMQALGVLNDSLSFDVVLAEPSFPSWDGVPASDSIDWSEVWNFEPQTAEAVSGS